MLRSLAEIVAVMPADAASRAEIMRSLVIGLKARNAEILEQGLMNKDKAIETVATFKVALKRHRLIATTE